MQLARPLCSRRAERGRTFVPSRDREEVRTERARYLLVVYKFVLVAELGSNGIFALRQDTFRGMHIPRHKKD